MAMTTPAPTQRHRVRELFDKLAPERAHWKRRNAYYYRKITEYFRFIVPEGSRVLEIGSGDGDLLAALKPSRGLGIEASPKFVEISKKSHPHLEFQEAFAEDFKLIPNETFDFIILSDLVGYVDDLQSVLQNLQQACHPSTRILIHCFSYLWEPVLKAGAALKFNMKQEATQNWLSIPDLENLVQISGFEKVKTMRKLIFPIYIPLISGFMNRIVANLPLVRRLCLSQFIIARPIPKNEASAPSVSIVVAVRNEKGNIRELVARTPSFPGGSEIIFVDGRSTDNTPEEIQKAAMEYPEKNVRLYRQEEASGKGGAVRIGFEKAKGELLIILDGDISVAPEDMTKFYELLRMRTGEFMNGNRMVYPMEKQAMRTLNILGNKFFSIAFTYLLDQRIKDTLCGTKAIYKSDYEKLAANRAFFGEFDPFGDFDLLFGAAKLNLKIVEVPVRYYDRHYGVTKIKRFQHGLLLLGMCFIAARKIKFI